jgi:hypothetical protein
VLLGEKPNARWGSLYKSERRFERAERQPRETRALRPHSHCNCRPRASAGLYRKLVPPCLRRHALVFERQGRVAEHERGGSSLRRRWHGSKHAPLGRVQVALRRRFGPQRTRLEAVKLRPRLPIDATKTHGDRRGTLPSHCL